MLYLIPVADNDLPAAAAGLLEALLQQGLVEAVFTPLRLPSGDSVAPALVREARLLDQADPFAPVMLINGARAVSALTSGSGAGAKIAVVLRSCELRALIELAKLKQANLDNLLLIGVDCLGAYEPADYLRRRRDGVDPAAGLLAAWRMGEAAEGLRPACRMCEHPAPEGAQITLGVIGAQQGLLVETDDETAHRLGLAAAPADLAQERQEGIRTLVAQHTACRAEATAAFRAQVNGGPAALAAYFAACQRCHNCMVACPICYCKECLFRTTALEHDPVQYLRWAGRKGAARLPADTVLFHLTRLNHMSTSCVGCGLCESACPNDVPLTILFRTVAAGTQALFGYTPGRSLADELPLTTFREAELQTVTV